MKWSRSGVAKKDKLHFPAYTEASTLCGSPLSSPHPKKKNLTRIRKASERNLPSQCSSDRTGCTIPHSPKNCAARYCMRESKTSNYTRRSIQVSPMPFPVPFPFPAFLLLSFSQRPPPPSRTTAWTGEEVKGTGTGMIFA